MGRIVERDLGLTAALKRIRSAAGAGVSIGVHGDSPSYVRGSGVPATGPQVAAFNEFGTLDMYGVSAPNDGRVGVPERSFIRSTVDENLSEYRQIEAEAMGRVIDGSIDARRAMGLIGEKVKADIQAKITALSDPPNAARTIEAKGSSNPLIDDGQLRKSITYRVRAS